MISCCELAAQSSSDVLCPCERVSSLRVHAWAFAVTIMARDAEYLSVECDRVWFL